MDRWPESLEGKEALLAPEFERWVVMASWAFRMSNTCAQCWASCCNTDLEKHPMRRDKDDHTNHIFLVLIL